ncbi:MAG TPA: hypothetical protein VI260_04520 [Blastocatellia bacterium]|jgi:hypothetical protein
MKRWITLIALTLLLAAAPAAAQSYEFPVEHDHTLRSCRGSLVITPEKIEYKTAHETHARAWRYIELQQVKVESKTRIELLTYEDEKRLAWRDREWSFKILEGEITPEISALLQAQSARPLVTSVPPVTEGSPRFEIPVKHLHKLGGCSGALRIYADRVAFESAERPDHSRFWRYKDIQNFSQSERFRFEIATFETGFVGSKSYSFQLKQELPEQAYDYVWARVYQSKFRRDDDRESCSVRQAASKAGVSRQAMM